MQTMQMTRMKKILSFVLCIVLVAAIALFTTGCNGNTDTSGSTDAPETTAAQTEVITLGEGEIQFNFTITDLEGNETSYLIATDKTTVGEALLELGLIGGEEGAYGLYVKTVSGITLDYDTDGKYWAFYVDGEYATAGVDKTDITDGAAYAFKAE